MDPTPVISRSARVYGTLRAEILDGRFAPGQPLKPQDLADRLGVSLAVVREALLRLVGEGLAERLPNRGFTAPKADDRRWEELSDARAALEPQLLRLAIARGDAAWEAGVRAAFRELDETPVHDGDGPQVSDAWSRAHHRFHRALLEGCDNRVLLDTFERLWRLSELARRWSALGSPAKARLGEHAVLEEAALARDADRAAAALAAHLHRTTALLGRSGPAVEDARR
ncbi:GntR family transcriptional regulator [Microlunatus spumicola]|uniref:GntR family transcriptional regulator n=1 Tax=Microlunatus spumicola TaxID=81499 RepID=A0ABP6WKZ4_9ACTN